MKRGKGSKSKFRDPYAGWGDFKTIGERLVDLGFFAPNCFAFDSASYRVMSFSDGSNLLLQKIHEREKPVLLYDTIEDRVFLSIAWSMERRDVKKLITAMAKAHTGERDAEIKDADMAERTETKEFRDVLNAQ